MRKTRPVKMNDVAQRKLQNSFLNELARGKKLVPALHALNQDSRDLARWKKDPQFREMFELVRERTVDELEDAFQELVEERNPQVVMFGLKTLGKNRGFVERQEVAHFGAAGIKIEFGDLDKSKDIANNSPGCAGHEKLDEPEEITDEEENAPEEL